MPKYLLVYHGATGPMPSSQEEIDKVMAAWGAWFGTLGDAVVDGGNPVGKSITVHPGGKVTNDGGSDPATGYSILSANSEAEVAEMAKGCPHLGDGGRIEIAPIMEM